MFFSLKFIFYNFHPPKAASNSLAIAKHKRSWYGAAITWNKLQKLKKMNANAVETHLRYHKKEKTEKSGLWRKN